MRPRAKTILLSLLLIITLPVIFLAVRSPSILRIGAQLIPMLETEGGVLSGSVTEKIDSAASGGKYIEFTGAGGSFYDTFFPIGAFDTLPGPNEFNVYVADVQSSGMDSLLQNPAHVKNSNQQNLYTAADQKNWNLIVGEIGELRSQWWDNTTKIETLDEAKRIAQPLVDVIKNHPSIKAYNLIDDAGGQTLSEINLMQQAFNELEPTHPASTMEKDWTGRPIFLERYFLTPKAAAYPRVHLNYHYFAGRESAPCSNTGWPNAHREFIQFIPPDIPIYQALQTHQTEKNYLGQDIGGGLRYPTVEELRLQQWVAVGEGVRGIFWFTYSDLHDTNPSNYSWIGWKNKPEFKTEILDLTKRLQPMKPILSRTKKIDDKFTATGTGRVYISTLKHRDTNRLFVLVVNQECSQQSVTVGSNFVAGQLKDIETGTVQAMNTPISLRGGDGKLFELVSPNLISPQPTPAPVTNIVQNGSFESLDSTGKPLNWTVSASMIDKTVAHSGTNSVKIQGPQAFSYWHQSPALTPLKKYMVTFWAKTNGAKFRTSPHSLSNNEGIGVRYNQISPSAMTLMSEDSFVAGTHEWVRVFKLISIPSNFVSGRLDIIANLSNSATVWIDDIQICDMANLSCTPLEFTTLQPFNTTGTPPTPTRTPTPGAPTPTKTPTPQPSTTPNQEQPDINGDGKVDIADLWLVIKNWFSTGSCSTFTCDVHADGKVNGMDFTKVVKAMVIPTSNPTATPTPGTNPTPTRTPTPTLTKTPTPTSPPTSGDTITISGQNFQYNGQPFDMWGVRVASASQNDTNKNNLINNLSDYKLHGVNTITVFYMGSSGGFTNPFNADGTALDAGHKSRMEQIINAAASRDMAVIVGIFYQRTVFPYSDITKTKNAVKTAATVLKPYRNVIINIANEQNSTSYNYTSYIQSPSGIIELCGVVHSVDSTRLCGGGGYDNTKNIAIGKGSSIDALLFDTNETSDNSATFFDQFVAAGVTNKPIVNVEMIGAGTTTTVQGVLPDSLKNVMKTEATRARDKGGLYMFLHYNTWFQGGKQGFPNRFDLAGFGTSSDPGVHWYFDHVATLRGLNPH